MSTTAFSWYPGSCPAAQGVTGRIRIQDDLELEEAGEQLSGIPGGSLNPCGGFSSVKLVMGL